MPSFFLQDVFQQMLDDLLRQLLSAERRKGSTRRRPRDDARSSRMRLATNRNVIRSLICNVRALRKMAMRVSMSGG
jgi:hypothetical protein